MCCDPEKRAARAQRKLLHQQEREARRYGHALPLTSASLLTTSNDSISMTEVARALQFLEERGELSQISTTNTAFNDNEKEARPGLVNPPSYGAVMGKSASGDREDTQLLEEKNAAAVAIARQSVERSALATGSQSGNDCGHYRCRGGACNQDCALGARGCGYGGCGRRGGCHSPTFMLVKFVYRKVKESREKKALKRATETEKA